MKAARRDFSAEQVALCKRFQVDPFPTSDKLKVGIALSTLALKPIHGVRHKPSGDTSGWYFWGGEYSSHTDFFDALHLEHMINYCPLVLPYLLLPPGWRLIVTSDYEDVWYDENLNVE